MYGSDTFLALLIAPFWTACTNGQSKAIILPVLCSNWKSFPPSFFSFSFPTALTSMPCWRVAQDLSGDATSVGSYFCLELISIADNFPNRKTSSRRGRMQHHSGQHRFLNNHVSLVDIKVQLSSILKRDPSYKIMVASQVLCCCQSLLGAVLPPVHLGSYACT